MIFGWVDRWHHQPDAATSQTGFQNKVKDGRSPRLGTPPLHWAGSLQSGGVDDPNHRSLGARGRKALGGALLDNGGFLPNF